MNKWFVVSASVIGKSHIVSNLPCQDESFFRPLKNGWGIAIVCDGAGSAENSALGASLVATDYAPKYFEEILSRNNWIESDKLPSEKKWEEESLQAFFNCYNDLKLYSIQESLSISSLACTIIVVIYSPNGLLVSHIGDGRAAYCDKTGQWHSIIKPHKGEEANFTIFLTSEAWQKEKFMLSETSIPESRVIIDEINAFTLMSDGCENHSFECSVMDLETNKWFDPNKPFSGFFDPLVKSLKNIATGSTYLNANDEWKKFITEGTDGLKNESDDKSMILGVLI